MGTGPYVLVVIEVADGEFSNPTEEFTHLVGYGLLVVELGFFFKL
jgi:hypothetical protein